MWYLWSLAFVFALLSFTSPKHDVEETKELETVIPFSGSSFFLHKNGEGLLQTQVITNQGHTNDE